ncbi:uncharacterized protein PADG_12051 [Paracoccidioides brasiliensis Pb18]|uniref:Uncharacterized protein n=1 Tax=Paracoccidioides brasiliensis (strain Pb18) TaxID=502780 RepID=A0A0A0HUT0_PARBD|nr:uncharacterized protein PADG_12051 [Paracoccidioides brasiliensis Pb18]KGM91746.1 hypothetical protein PADG_12051 [Paracoccidioides brasiliensis Pb18]
MFPPELPGPDLRKICSAWIESRADHQLLATPARARGANISTRPLLDLIKIAFEPIVHDICDWDKETVTGILEEMHFNFRSSYLKSKNHIVAGRTSQSCSRLSPSNGQMLMKSSRLLASQGKALGQLWWTKDPFHNITN